MALSFVAPQRSILASRLPDAKMRGIHCCRAKPSLQ